MKAGGAFYRWRKLLIPKGWRSICKLLQGTYGPSVWFWNIQQSCKVCVMSYSIAHSNKAVSLLCIGMGKFMDLILWYFSSFFPFPHSSYLGNTFQLSSYIIVEHVVTIPSLLPKSIRLQYFPCWASFSPSPSLLVCLRFEPHNLECASDLHSGAQFWFGGLD